MPSLQTLTLVHLASSTSTESAESSELGVPEFSVGSYEQRYRVDSFIGEGGMGKVYLGFDSLLRREVAIKYSRESSGAMEAQRLFWYEALNSGKLDHPCIPPVYDVGVDSKGQPFYVMRLIRGTSLRRVLDPARPELEWGLTRLLSAFVQVCGAVQFAHEEKILHLDIKPENIMVGTYGDVYLVDWGLSKQLDAVAPRGMRGSPPYMAPEQISGSLPTTATDVFALGVILYELVVGARPFVAESLSDLMRVIREEPFSRSEGWNRCPLELRELIAAALEKSTETRLSSAAELAERVQKFLDGRKEKQRRQQDANQSLQQAMLELADYDRLCEEAQRLELQLGMFSIEDWAGVREKRPLWACEDSLQICRHDAAVVMESALRHLVQAHKEEPDDIRVRESLAQIYWRRFEAAEASGDDFQKLFLETQLKGLDLKKINDRLSGRGTLTLHCAPKPESIVLCRLVENDRVLQPVDPVHLLAEQLDSIPLAMGRYQITLSRAGYRSIVAPISIARGEAVALSWEFRLESEIGEGFLQIPPGKFTMGGDDRTFKSVNRRVCDVEEFAMAKFPVTWAEYKEFLQAVAYKSISLAEARLPKVNSGVPNTWFVNSEGCVGWKEFNEEAEKNWPIFMVTYQDATDYCSWRSERDGKQYSLPTDQQWEKAARGVDARIFPWGDCFDASFCKNSKSTSETAQPEDVGTYAKDRSPYGVRDLAGGVREWCSTWFDEKDSQMLVRGGSWNFSSIGAHCAYRLGCAPNEAYPFIGFRLVHTYRSNP